MIAMSRNEDMSRSMEDRQNIAENVKEAGASETYYINMASASAESLHHVNYDNVPSKPALRQMLHEKTNKELLDRDILYKPGVLFVGHRQTV